MREFLAWTSISVALLCALVIAADEFRHPQKMAVMNVVWPATALYGSVFALWAYVAKGRQMSGDAMQSMPPGHAAEAQEGPRKAVGPTVTQVALAGSHCGAGCVLADIVTEFAVFGAGATLFGLELYASFLWDFVVAWLLGILFQYFAIKPMRNLSTGGAIWAAVKADTLSILTFQIGMYGFMAWVFFKLPFHERLHPDQACYWLMMQVAMICGYVTALPMNWLLIKLGWKEAMG